MLMFVDISDTIRSVKFIQCQKSSRKRIWRGGTESSLSADKPRDCPYYLELELFLCIKKTLKIGLTASSVYIVRMHVIAY